ncbi:hypothetical protein VII00023_13912 [Vibrio ichthyoenteri ATCC 700023]|uniref:Uncharacterized protein n=1 Tax=Vibrio ichthyoenteri ATCC 700023 TaxID=870968 RepID=F9RWZ6_9VIBR|nr:hypothetical protein [Vibrio ichthyoenteri]EGU48910.1 hypothetical protein VII00023_13912 [Vibrio ichthyoenteri ATCC 700023]
MKTNIYTHTSDNNLLQEFALDKSSSRIILKSFHAALIAIAICLLVNVALRIDYVFLGNTLGEASVTEILELVMLAISSASFFLVAKQRPTLKHAAVLVGSFFLVMFIRENDGWLDHISHGSWIYPALLTTFAAIAYAAKNGKQSFTQLAVILNTPSANLLILGLMMLLVYSRLMGMGDFWKDVMSEHYIRDVKNIVEESTELLAYCIIAYASVKIQRHLKKA